MKKQNTQQCLVRVATSKLKLHPDNPREHDEQNIQTIIKSYKEFGELGPVVIWGPKNYVISGNGRLIAARQLGMKFIYAIRADHLSEKQAKAFLIMANASSDSSTWSKTKLQEIIIELNGKKIDLDITGLQKIEIEPLLQAADSSEDFKSFDENLITEFTCPKCGYEWSGKC